MADPTFFEVVRSQRGIRFYKPDPISDEIVEKLLQAAVWAPSASNRQQWSFIVIRDPEVKRKLGELYQEGSAIARGAGHLPPPAGGGQSDPALDFARDMEHVPVVIMACMEKHSTQQRESLLGSSIYPAVQNLMLAAAALGIGTRITTIWHNVDEKVAALLEIPDDVEAMALIPVGYPNAGDHLGGSKRRPVAEVTHYDRWGGSKLGS